MKKIILALFLALSLVVPHIASAKDYASIDAKVNDLTQVVYDSGELANAATSITINGLDGDVDDEYKLIGRFVNGYNGQSVYSIKFNNDAGANYGYQEVNGVDSATAASRIGGNGNILLGLCAAQNQLSFSRHSLSVKSGYVRTCISDSVFSVSGSTVTEIIKLGQSWNNTADNVTSLVVGSSQANGIGVGSRVILLRKVNATSGKKYGAMNIKGQVRNTWQQVYSGTLTEAATSVTISNLTGNSDVLYRLRTRVVNGYAGTITVMARPNNDSGTNYGYQRIYGENTTVASSRETAYSGIYLLNTSNGSVAQSEDLIYAKSGYVRSGLNQDTENIITTTVADIQLKGQVWNNTADEITSIVILANQTDGLGIGTEIVLERLNL